ncbi:MAG: hypothetical protein WD824_24685 [Cyclobacteriaceae bacterium]
MNKLKSAFFFLLAVISACSSPEFVSPKELTSFILEPENGLVKKKEVNGHNIEVLFRPTDLLIYQEAKNQLLDEDHYRSLRRKYDPNVYFILKIQKGDREALRFQNHPYQYGALVQKLSFGMTDFVNLTTSSDTIPVMAFSIDRTYDLGNSTKLIFVFDRKKVENHEWVQFNLSEFGLGLGYQHFRFKVDDLKRLPSIEFPI